MHPGFFSHNINDSCSLGLSQSCNRYERKRNEERNKERIKEWMHVIKQTERMKTQKERQTNPKWITHLDGYKQDKWKIIFIKILEK